MEHTISIVQLHSEGGGLRYPRGDNIKTPARSRCLVLNLEQLENWLWDYLSNMLILGDQCLGTAGN